MKVDISTKITGINKEVMKSDGENLTLKKVLLMALVLPNPDSKGTSPEEAVKTRKIFNKIDDAEAEVDLSSQEIVKLKELVSKRLSEVVAGAACLILEPEV